MALKRDFYSEFYTPKSFETYKKEKIFKINVLGGRQLSEKELFEEWSKEELEKKYWINKLKKREIEKDFAIQS